MMINADFESRVVVHSGSMPWVDSPMAGVQRRPLDRVGGEVARATSVVRYAAGSHFSPHVHVGGEEFYVIEGVFQDQRGDFPAGSYIRNPPQSSHTPRSEQGCTILVKLWQFAPQDRTHVCLQTNHMQAIPHADLPGVEMVSLYCDDREQVSLQHWHPKQEINLNPTKGLELFVLAGAVVEQGETLVEGGWLRLPSGAALHAIAGDEGAKVWIKQNHLGGVDKEIERLREVATD